MPYVAFFHLRWSGQSHTSSLRWNSLCEYAVPTLHMRSSLAICRDPHTGILHGTGPDLRYNPVQLTRTRLMFILMCAVVSVSLQHTQISQPKQMQCTWCTHILTSLLFMIVFLCFSGLGSQMGRSVGAQFWSCTAEWLQIRLFSTREHNDTIPVRLPNVHIW